jgi:tripartite-type tricarboxylate transporter receptor subunit TctC
MKKLAALLFACAACSTTARAQNSADFPQHPMRLITGFLPGGVSDTIARVVGERLGDRLGQRVVIDGRPGAGGILSMEIAANANPDGHTMYLGQPVITISPNFKNKPPFDTITAFAPVSQIGTGPTMLTVHPTLPVNTVKELIAYARTQPGGLRYGSSGPGTTNHFSGELLRVMSGMPLTHVPYRGAANVVVAAIQGEIHIAFLPLLAAIPHVKANRLKGLAVTGAKRSRAVPDLPTVAETLPGYAVEAWYGIMVPAKTPGLVIQKLDRTLAQILATPEMRERLAGQGVEVDYLGPAPFGDMIRKDALRWAKLVKDGGIVLE